MIWHQADSPTVTKGCLKARSNPCVQYRTACQSLPLPGGGRWIWRGEPDKSSADERGMEMLRRSSVFAAEVMEVFDRSPTDKELVSQAKALCRDYIHSRLNRAGIGWSKPEHGLVASGGTLGEISSVLIWLGR